MTTWIRKKGMLAPRFGFVPSVSSLAFSKLKVCGSPHWPILANCGCPKSGSNMDNLWGEQAPPHRPAKKNTVKSDVTKQTDLLEEILPNTIWGTKCSDSCSRVSCIHFNNLANADRWRCSPIQCKLGFPNPQTKFAIVCRRTLAAPKLQRQPRPVRLLYPDACMKKWQQTSSRYENASLLIASSLAAISAAISFRRSDICSGFAHL